jgi:4-azaleucine resistance transporter AzlC
MNSRQFREGAKSALPIVLGYLPVGMAFGILARNAGLTPFEIGLMSLLVYAGASQFIAVEMISKGVLGWPIVLTTFLINFRHFLMSSTLFLHFQKLPLRTLGFLSAQLTDESFGMALSAPSRTQNRPDFLFGLQVTSHLAWISGSVIGGLFGGLIDPRSFGLAFALPGLFICLLVFQIKSLPHFWVMIIAGGMSLFFKWALPGNGSIVLAALFAAGCGVWIGARKGT